MRSTKWKEGFRSPCKIGTIPMVVRVDKRCALKVGNLIRIQEKLSGEWYWVKVTRVDEDGYFMADR